MGLCPGRYPGYPAVYYMQKLFIETMARSDEQDSYLSIITSYVGSRWGVLFGALYSFTMLKSMVEYALPLPTTAPRI